MTAPRLGDRLHAFLEGSCDVNHSAAQLAAAGVGVSLLLTQRSMSAEARAALKAATLGQVAHTLLAEQAAERVVRGLRQACIRHVRLKGRELAETWAGGWSRPEARTWGDVDLLVLEDDVDAVVNALEPLGARPGPRSTFEMTVPLEGSTALDLHWGLLNDADLASRYQLRTETIFEQHVVWHGPTGRLDSPMLLLHTVLHAVMSDLSRPAALLDVDGAARGASDRWDEVEALAVSHRAQLPLALGLRAARTWLGTPIPDEMLSRLGGRSLWLRAMEGVLRRDPAQHLASGWSGGELFRHTRDTDRASLVSLVRSLPEQAQVRWRLRRAG